MRGFSLLMCIALVGVPLLAGCAGNDSNDDEVTDPIVQPPQDEGLDASGNVAVYPGIAPVMVQHAVSNSDRTAGEPTIAVNREGFAIYPSIAFDSMGGQPLTRLYGTADQGVTWTDVSPKLPDGSDAHPVTVDPYVYADPTTGRLFTVDLNLALGAFVSFSDDSGATWTTNPICCGVPVNDHQTFFGGRPPGPLESSPLYENYLYYCWNAVADAGCSRSLDGGVTWTVSGAPSYRDPVRPSTNPGQGVCGSLHGHGHVNRVTGTVYVPKVHCGTPTISVSRDAGITWGEDQVNDAGFIVVNRTIGGEGHEAIVSSDFAGNVYYFWLDRDGFARLSVSHDDGSTWGPAINVTAPGVTALKFPSIVAGDEGRIAFLYLGSEVVGGFDATEEDMYNATWNAYVGFSLNAHEDNPIFTTITANDRADPLNRGSCDGRCQVPGGGGMYDFLDIDINPVTGAVWVALVDNCRDACALPDGTADMQTTGTGAIGVQVGGTTLLAVSDVPVTPAEPEAKQYALIPTPSVVERRKVA